MKGLSDELRKLFRSQVLSVLVDLTEENGQNPEQYFSPTDVFFPLRPNHNEDLFGVLYTESLSVYLDELCNEDLALRVKVGGFRGRTVFGYRANLDNKEDIEEALKYKDYTLGLVPREDSEGQ